MWYSVYSTTTGEYLGGSALRSNIADPLPAGKAIRESETRKEQTHDWDKQTMDWVDRPPVRDFHIRVFLENFTEDELFAYGTNRSAGVGDVKATLQIWEQARKKINLDSPRTAALMQVLVDQEILTSERRDEIIG